MDLSDKGKLAARRGRKATGLTEPAGLPSARFRTAAQLPYQRTETVVRRSLTVAAALGSLLLCQMGPVRALAAGAPTVPVACPGTQSGCIHAMLTILNHDRHAAGLAPLKLTMTQTNGYAACVGSLGHSVAMAQTGTIWHTNSRDPKASFPRNICMRYSTAGENVGMSARGDEMQDLKGLDKLMMSEPHNASVCASTANHACNILNPQFHRVGIGLYQSGTTTWLTEDFVN